MECAEDAQGAAWLVEAGCQEATQKKETEKKRRKRRTVERDTPGMKLLKKWLRASRRRQARKIENEEEEEDEDWKKGTRWKCNGMRMKTWKRFWNEEERKEVPCRQKSCKRYLNWYYMSVCPDVKKRKG